MQPGPRSSRRTLPAWPRSQGRLPHRTDNYSGGKEAARAMIEALGEGRRGGGHPRLQGGRVVYPPRQRLQEEIAKHKRIRQGREDPHRGRVARRRVQGPGLQSGRRPPPGPSPGGGHLRHQRSLGPRGARGPGKGRASRSGQDHRLRRPARGKQAIKEGKIYATRSSIPTGSGARRYARSCATSTARRCPRRF